MPRKSTNPATVFALCVCVIAVAVVVPLSFRRAAHHRAAREEATSAAMERLEQEQTAALRVAIALRQRLTDLDAVLTDLEQKTDAIDAELAAKEKSGEPAIGDDAAVVAQFGKDVRQQLSELETDTRAALIRARREAEEASNRYVVKWHTGKGVRSSHRLRSESDAVLFFNDLGERAKKLLVRDQVRWITLREFGDQRWLTTIHNDGNEQDGGVGDP